MARKLAKPRSVRGTASGTSKTAKARKRPVLKQARKTKKAKILKLPTRRFGFRYGRSLGGAEGFVDALKGYYDEARETIGKHYDDLSDTLGKHYDEAKDRLGKFYDENEEAIDLAAKIALATLTTAGLSYGAYQLLQDPKVLATIANLKNVAGPIGAIAIRLEGMLGRTLGSDSDAPGSRPAAMPRPAAVPAYTIPAAEVREVQQAMQRRAGNGNNPSARPSARPQGVSIPGPAVPFDFDKTFAGLSQKEQREAAAAEVAQARQVQANLLKVVQQLQPTDTGFADRMNMLSTAGKVRAAQQLEARREAELKAAQQLLEPQSRVPHFLEDEYGPAAAATYIGQMPVPGSRFDRPPPTLADEQAARTMLRSAALPVASQSSRYAAPAASYAPPMMANIRAATEQRAANNARNMQALLRSGTVRR